VNRLCGEATALVKDRSGDRGGLAAAVSGKAGSLERRASCEDALAVVVSGRVFSPRTEVAAEVACRVTATSLGRTSDGGLGRGSAAGVGTGSLVLASEGLTWRLSRDVCGDKRGTASFGTARRTTFGSAVRSCAGG